MSTFLLPGLLMKVVEASYEASFYIVEVLTRIIQMALWLCGKLVEYLIFSLFW